MKGELVVLVAGGHRIEENDIHSVREDTVPGEGAYTYEIASMVAAQLTADGYGVLVADANFNGQGNALRQFGACVLLRAHAGSASGYWTRGGGLDSDNDSSKLSASLHRAYGSLSIPALEPHAELPPSYLVPYLHPETPFAEVSLGTLGAEDNRIPADLLFLGMHREAIADAITKGIKDFFGDEVVEQETPQNRSWQNRRPWGGA